MSVDCNGFFFQGPQPYFALEGMVALKCRLLKIYFHLRGMTRNSEVDKTETDTRRIFVGYLF